MKGTVLRILFIIIALNRVSMAAPREDRPGKS